MPKSYYNPQTAREQISLLLDRFSDSYQELMDSHRDILYYARTGLKNDKAIQESIRELKKKALNVSLREISKSQPIYPSLISKEYPQLDGATRKLYLRNNRKSSLQLACEDAGANFQRRHKKRNLKQLLEDISSIGHNPEDFTSDVFYNPPYQGLGKVIKKRFGRIGKGVILAGIDYSKKQNSAIKRESFVFSPDELEIIAKDKSLDYSQKGACFFNALSFGHYPDLKIDFLRTHNPRDYSLNKGEDESDLLSYENFERFGIATGLSIFNGGNSITRVHSDSYNCDLLLHSSIKNPFHFTRFHFKLTKRNLSSLPEETTDEIKARLPAMLFYSQLNETLSKLEYQLFS
jgi:hypothetical protein